MPPPISSSRPLSYLVRVHDETKSLQQERVPSCGCPPSNPGLRREIDVCNPKCQNFRYVANSVKAEEEAEVRVEVGSVTATDEEQPPSTTYHEVDE